MPAVPQCHKCAATQLAQSQGQCHVAIALPRHSYTIASPHKRHCHSKSNNHLRLAKLRGRHQATAAMHVLARFPDSTASAASSCACAALPWKFPTRFGPEGFSAHAMYVALALGTESKHRYNQLRHSLALRHMSSISKPRSRRARRCSTYNRTLRRRQPRSAHHCSNLT